MFAQSFVDAQVETNRGWSVLMSLFFQMAAVLLLITVPLMKPEMLPKAVANLVTIAPPASAPVPPAPQQTAPAAQTRRAPADWANSLIAPFKIPKEVARFFDEPPSDSGPNIRGMESLASAGPQNSIANSVANVRPAAPPPAPAAAQHAETPQPAIVRIPVGGNVQEALLTNKVIPTYPRVAIQARVEGTVRFSAIISKTGEVTNLTLLGGNPLLVQAAADAVRQWKYKPTYLNGDPVEVATTIDVRFTLARR
jgi:periplasmic protein TonB